MKKVYFYFILFLNVFASFHNNAQSWVNVGNPGFSLGTVSYTSIAINRSGVPYVAYSDGNYYGAVSVMKYTSSSGGSWVHVGTPGFSEDAQAQYVSLAIDNNGTPYVAYQDGADGPASAMKYNGSSWVYLGGGPGFSASEAVSTSIAIGIGDTPYVAYVDFANDGKATVMKYDGSSWLSVGSAGFSAGVVENNISIAIDRDGRPFVAYVDGDSGKVTVMKYDSSRWVAVGNVDFTGDGADYTSLAVDNSGTPYIAYQDGLYSWATVMKYDGSSWVAVGGPGFSGVGNAVNPAIAIDHSGASYVVYCDYSSDDGNNGAATVMKFNSSWVTTGSAGFSGAQVQYPSIAIDSIGAYVVYEDGGNSNKATVMQYLLPVGVKNVSNVEISLITFPNPNHGSFTLNIFSPQKEDATIIITNVLGEKVKEVTANTNTNTQMHLDSPPGMYIISAVTIEGRQTGKVMVW